MCVQPQNPFMTNYHNLSNRVSSVFYGWWLVSLTVILLTFTSLGIFQGLGTFIVALERHFGWSRTSLTGAFALARVEGSILGPIAGLFIDRIGTRRMFMIGFSIMGFGFLLFSVVQELWHFYAAFAVITLGSGLGTWLALVSCVNNWFIRRRAIALAIATSGIHLGGFLVPLLALGIESSGFRAVTAGIGTIMLVLSVIGARFIRNRPEEYNLRPDGDLPEGTSEQLIAVDQPIKPLLDEPQFTTRQAVRTQAFWFIALAHASSSVGIITLSVHLVPKLTDEGISLATAALVVTTYTAVAIPFQILVGYIADKVPKPPLLAISLSVQATSLVVIAVSSSLEIAFVFAFLFGAAFGGRMPLLTSIRGEYFGRRSFASITGLSQLPSNLLMLGAPIFAAYFNEIQGSYFIPFISIAAFNYLGALFALLAKKPGIPKDQILISE